MKMSKHAETALRGSIAKWEAIVAGTGTDRGGANCPLCKVFLHRTTPGKNYCYGCPVAEHTHRTMCYGTPYYDVLLPLDIRIDELPEDEQPEARRTAQAELDFLRSLLPTDEKHAP